MRVLIITVALVLSAAAPASAEFFPVDQGPPQPCNDTITPSVPGTGPIATAAQCLAPSLVPVAPAQIRRIVAFKVRAVWGTYAARHIARYGVGPTNCPRVPRAGRRRSAPSGSAAGSRTS